MKNNRVLIAICLAMLLFVVFAVAVENPSREVILGKEYQEAIEKCNAKDDVIAATYKSETIMQSTVDYQRNVLKTLQEDITDKEVVDRIITNLIMLEEASVRGLDATEVEIAQFLEDTVYATYATSEGKEYLDSYCLSAGLTFEEYVETQREQGPSIIAKAKLEEEIAKEYCAQNGIKFDSLNPSQDVLEAIDAYKDNLLIKHKDDIVYYVDKRF